MKHKDYGDKSPRAEGGRREGGSKGESKCTHLLSSVTASGLLTAEASTPAKAERQISWIETWNSARESY